MTASLFFDPTPAVERAIPRARGVVVVGGETGSTVQVDFMGSRYSARALGSVNAGDMVSVVRTRNTTWAINNLGLFPSSIPRRLSGWAKQPASLAMRQLMDGNQRRYQYLPVQILTAVSSGSSASCRTPDGRTINCSFHWGGQDITNTMQAGRGLARLIGGRYRLVSPPADLEPFEIDTTFGFLSPERGGRGIELPARNRVVIDRMIGYVAKVYEQPLSPAYMLHHGLFIFSSKEFDPMNPFVHATQSASESAEPAGFSKEDTSSNGTYRVPVVVDTGEIEKEFNRIRLYVHVAGLYGPIDNLDTVHYAYGDNVNLGRYYVKIYGRRTAT